MNRILGGIDTISEWSGKGLSMLLLALLGILLWEITVRYVFNSPTVWAHGISRHIFGAYVVLSGAYVLLHHRHIRIDAIYMRFSSRWKAIVDLITFPLFLLVVILLLVYGIENAMLSVERLEMEQPPTPLAIYPLKITIPIGAFLLLLQGLAHFIRNLSIAIRGKELA